MTYSSHHPAGLVIDDLCAMTQTSSRESAAEIGAETIIEIEVKTLLSYDDGEV